MVNLHLGGRFDLAKMKFDLQAKLHFSVAIMENL
jgi:hypothetical protein